MTAMAFDLNWLHPDVEARPAGVKGTGSYADAADPRRHHGRGLRRRRW